MRAAILSLLLILFACQTSASPPPETPRSASPAAEPQQEPETEPEPEPVQSGSCFEDCVRRRVSNGESTEDAEAQCMQDCNDGE